MILVSGFADRDVFDLNVGELFSVSWTLESLTGDAGQPDRVAEGGLMMGITDTNLRGWPGVEFSGGASPPDTSASSCAGMWVSMWSDVTRDEMRFMKRICSSFFNRHLWAFSVVTSPHLGEVLGTSWFSFVGKLVDHMSLGSGSLSSYYDGIAEYRPAIVWYSWIRHCRKHWSRKFETARWGTLRARSKLHSDAYQECWFVEGTWCFSLQAGRGE